VFLSNKYKKAKEKNTLIISEEEFSNKLKKRFGYTLKS